jgi:UbiD family decarboxylase
MPVAVAIGRISFILSFFLRVPWGVSEYDYAGGIKGSGEVIRAYTDFRSPC